MKVILLLLLLLLGCQPVVESTDPKDAAASDPEAREVRVATWNVRNLFDAVDDRYHDEVPSKKEYQATLREKRAVVEALDADFLALQEVETVKVLEELNQGLSRPYPHVGLIEGNDQMRGIDVAFLSRLPVKAVRSHRDHDLPDLEGISPHHPFSRDCLEVDLDTEPKMILLVNHLKSQKGKEVKKSATKRRAQSQGVVEIATELEALEPGVAIVVLGDLNDRPGSWAVEPLFQAFHDPFQGLAREQRITHRYRKDGSALDHILLNPRAQEVASKPRVWQGLARETSDHDPVSLQFSLRFAAPTQEARTWTK